MCGWPEFRLVGSLLTQNTETGTGDTRRFDDLGDGLILLVAKACGVGEVRWIEHAGATHPFAFSSSNRIAALFMQQFSAAAALPDKRPGTPAATRADQAKLSPAPAPRRRRRPARRTRSCCVSNAAARNRSTTSSRKVLSKPLQQERSPAEPGCSRRRTWLTNSTWQS